MPPTSDKRNADAESSEPRKLGIFGGSFNPIHFGHLLLAESCREQCRLDQVWLLPAAVAPHKRQQPTADARHRVHMLELAISGHPALKVCTMEIDRGGVSYTVDTLTAIRERHPDTELFFLMGADSLDDLPHWHRPERICELAVPVVVRRAGSPEPNLDVLQGLVNRDRLEQIRRYQVQMPVIGLSSTEIRRRAAAGKSIRYRTPRAVEVYIRTHKLYRTAD